MRFGICTISENLELVCNAGYDYIELPVTEIESMSENDFENFKIKVKQCKFQRVENFYLMFPVTLRLIGKEADYTKIIAYLEKAFGRIKSLGGEAAGLGGGKSRTIPNDMPYSDGFKEMIKMTTYIGEAAAKYGITVPIEGLSKKDTNCINTVREAAMLEASVNHPSIKIMADLYHILSDNEPLENILMAKKLRHTHIALLENRSYPTFINDDVKNFFKVLNEIGYTGTMSIEGNSDDIERDAPASLKILRSMDNDMR